MPVESARQLLRVVGGGASALLHQLAPSTADSVRVAGTSASDFKITGPLRQSGVQPSFRGVGASVAVTWSAAELYGVKLGAPTWHPS